MDVLILESLERCISAGQVQLLLVPGLGPLGRIYKMMCVWLLLVLGMEVSGRCYTVN